MPVTDSILCCIETDIERFFTSIAAPSPAEALQRFFGDSPDSPVFRPRGQQRCKLLLLLEECFKSGRPALITPLLELGLFPIVADLLLTPHTCNALHMRTAAILEWAISFTSGPTELITAVRKSLLQEAQLASRLLALVAEYAPPPAERSTDAEPSSPPPPKGKGKILPCCHAFVMHLGACLLTASQREPEIRELLELCEGWAGFIAPGGALTVWGGDAIEALGGLAPTRGSDNDSDDDEELDAAMMERVLAAQAAANSRDASLNDSDVGSAGG